MGFQLGKESGVTTVLVGIYSIRPPPPWCQFNWDVKKVINFSITSDSPNQQELKDLTLKLTVFPALTSAAKASEIDFGDIKYLAKYLFGYTFNFGKKTRHS